MHTDVKVANAKLESKLNETLLSPHKPVVPESVVGVLASSGGGGKSVSMSCVPVTATETASSATAVLAASGATGVAASADGAPGSAAGTAGTGGPASEGGPSAWGAMPVSWPAAS